MSFVAVLSRVLCAARRSPLDSMLYWVPCGFHVGVLPAVVPRPQPQRQRGRRRRRPPSSDSSSSTEARLRSWRTRSPTATAQGQAAQQPAPLSQGQAATEPAPLSQGHASPSVVDLLAQGQVAQPAPLSQGQAAPPTADATVCTGLQRRVTGKQFLPLGGDVASRLAFESSKAFMGEHINLSPPP